jgi:Na+/melibiose symporter-like transporter
MEIPNPDKVTPRTAARLGILVGVLSLPFVIFISHIADPGRGRAAGVALSLMVGGILAFWHLRRQVWFWITVAVLTIIHVALVVIIPWTNKSFPAPELWPIGIVDFVAICGSIALIERVMRRGTHV